MKVIDKLSTYASLVGVVCAIGGGFYAWGEFNTRLDVLEKKKFVVNETVDLDPVNDKISSLEVELIDRIANAEDKIKPQDMTWVLQAHIDIREDIAKIREEIAALDIPEETNLKPLNEAIKNLESKISELDTNVKIVQKENQLQDVLIEEIKTKANNPLAN